MAELADRLAAGASPAAGGAATPDESGDGGSSRRRPDAEARIRELVTERNAARAAQQQQSEQIQELREQFAELRGQMSVDGRSDGPIKSWSDVPDKDIPTALRAALNPEAPNPDAVFSAVDEMISRKLNSFQDDVLARGRQEVQHDAFSRQIEAEIKQRFGSDAEDTTSPLFERASAYVAQYKQVYGDDVLERHPDKALDAFARAKLDLTNGLADRVKELEAELERRKALGSMEPGSRAVPPPSDEVRDALKNRDPKAAIRALGAVQSLSRS